MPQFLVGLIFGSLFTGAELVGGLLLLPFVVLLLIAVAWGGYEAVVWYGVASAAYEPSAWYEWPWHWPGAHLSSEFFTFLDKVWCACADVPQRDEATQFLLAPPKVMLAIIINIFVAFLPLLLFSHGLRLVRWVRAGEQQQTTPTSRPEN